MGDQFEHYADIEALVAALEAATKAMTTEEPEESRAMRTGGLDSRAGSFGQYFGTWDIANGMIRDYSMYMQYPMLKIAEEGALSLSQFHNVFSNMDTFYSDYLRFSGYPQLGHFASAIKHHIGVAKTQQEVVALLRAYVGYTNRLAAWAFHYFPWGLGKQFQYDNPGQPFSVQPDLARRVHIKDGTRIRMTWQPLGISVEAVLATSENPELCRDIIDRLPFTVLQDHAVVTGESMYAWTPVVSTAPVRVRERICDAPAGRLRFSQSTGQKLIVQYGSTVEDLAQPVLGEIASDAVDRLRTVGREVWQSTFETKKQIWLTVELA